MLTRDARAVLPATVAHGDASAQAAELAFLLQALLAGDWTAAGRHLMRDRLAEPHRAPLVPVYDAVRQAALDAGAAGVALSGSGPALVRARPRRRPPVGRRRDGGRQPRRRHGRPGLGGPVDTEGVRVVDAP